MNRDFEKWIQGFRTTIATWDYYVNFEKVYRNTNKIKVELNILNSLVGSSNIENDFVELLDKYPEILKVVPILLAKREQEIKIIDPEEEYSFNFTKKNYSINEYVKFMAKTGLFHLLEKRIISDLTDYVKGVEVGLDTNARKNRTGTAMEDIVESFIIAAGFTKDVNYFKEMYKSKLEEKFELDLSTISNDGKTEKRFDFVVKTDNEVFAIETNFYSGGGSKLNETARSYELLALQSEGIEGFGFIWITDGKGWLKARNNLRQTFDVFDNIYNINDLENNILKKILI